MHINYEAIFIVSVVSYTLAFYFKNFLSLIEKHGVAAFIFFHFPVFSALCLSTDALAKTNDNITTMIFALVFLFRFFRQEHV